MPAKPSVAPKSPIKRRILAFASLGFAGLVAGLLAGCSGTPNAVVPGSYDQVAGNWKFASAAPFTATVPNLAGSLAATGAQLSGVLHPLDTPACIGSRAAFPVSGPVDSNGNAKLTSTGFTGGTVTVTGKLSADQRSLTNAAYDVTNGPCAMASSPATGNQFTAITGTYSGIIYSDRDSGTSFPVTTLFTQTSQPDANGTYHLQGNSTFGAVQPCLPIAPTVSDSLVTGNTLAATYTETQGSTIITVVVNGTFTPDAAALTLNSYQITGGVCDGDTGHGILYVSKSPA